MAINKICSGFEAGSEIAGIKVGVDLSIPTFGLMDSKFSTKYGCKHKYIKYGAMAYPADINIRHIIGWNIKHSDAVINFGYDFTSNRHKIVSKASQHFSKPILNMNIKDLESGCNLYFIDTYEWFEKYNIQCLYVSGSVGNNISDSKHIYNLVYTSLKSYIGNYNNL